MMTAVKRLIPATAPALVAAVALAGCGGTTMQEGVVVNGSAYSVQEVEETTRQFSELSGQDVAPQAVISIAGAVPVLDEYFAGSTYQASESSLRDELAGGGLDGEPGELTLDVARYQYYASVLNDPAVQADPAMADILAQVDGYAADVAEQDVRVNPRFGAWDPQAGQVVPQVPSWITPSDAS
jgi:hypothetical protein